MYWTSDTGLEFKTFTNLSEYLYQETLPRLSLLYRNLLISAMLLFGKKKILNQTPNAESRKASQFDSGPEGFCKRHDSSILLGKICRGRGLQRPSCFCLGVCFPCKNFGSLCAKQPHAAIYWQQSSSTVSQNSLTSLNSYTVGENPAIEIQSPVKQNKKIVWSKKTTVKVGETSAIIHNSTQLLYLQDVKVIVHMGIKIWVRRNKFFINDSHVFPNTLKKIAIFCISLKEDTWDWDGSTIVQRGWLWECVQSTGLSVEKIQWENDICNPLWTILTSHTWMSNVSSHF